MPTTYILPVSLHDEIVSAVYRHRGYGAEESAAAAKVASMAAWHGIKTHNAIKALHLDEVLGQAGGCVPNAKIEKLPTRFKVIEKWNCNRKLGQAVALEAMDRCMKLADEFGIGAVAVDNAFHYLWGGGYVIDAANRGYLAYTACTAGLAEVVPFGGKYPTLGTNPHSWAFPTTEAIGFPICIDWATSTVAMGRVQQFLREGKSLPQGCGVDENGNETCDPAKVKSLMTFGQHKGYGLALIDELLGAYIGGSLPTLRSRWTQGPKDEKHTPSFFFQCIHPEALSGNNFAQHRTQTQNVKAVIDDVLSHGNEKVMLPGQPEAKAAEQSKKHNGLLFTLAEIEEFEKLAAEAKIKFDRNSLQSIA
ncbi:MAG TPA: Ldh family oxidoreductase [Tepidisphaeraceae bacterium]|jgi:LDH2 family malate/lactate/ureidoglycolate dehydrogenase